MLRELRKQEVQLRELNDIEMEMVSGGEGGEDEVITTGTINRFHDNAADWASYMRTQAQNDNAGALAFGFLVGLTTGYFTRSNTASNMAGTAAAVLYDETVAGAAYLDALGDQLLAEGPEAWARIAYDGSLLLANHVTQ